MTLTKLDLGAQASSTQTLDLGGHPIQGLSDPVNPQDAATKNYVDSVAQGLNIHAACDYGTTGPLPAVTPAGTQVTHTLTANSNGVLSIDGNTTWFDMANDGSMNNHLLPLGAGGSFRASRVLVKDQVSQKDNGIYAVQDKGSVGSPFILVRYDDFNGVPSGEVAAGDFTFVANGGVNASTGWVQGDGNPTVNVDTDPIQFIQFSAAGVTLAGNGLDKSGVTIFVKPDTLTDGYATIGATSSGTRVVPAGSSSQIQFNKSGSLGASPNLVWDTVNNRLGINIVPLNALDVSGNARISGTLEVDTSATSPIMTAGSVTAGLGNSLVASNWTSVGNLNQARVYPMIITLPNGNALTAGGAYPNLSTSLASSEVYDHVAHTWTTTTGSMNTPRCFNMTCRPAIVLQSGPNAGNVLVVGGFSSGVNTAIGGSAEIYNVSTGTWSVAASPNSAIGGEVWLTQLNNGLILAVSNPISFGSARSQLYDPVAQTWGGTITVPNPSGNSWQTNGTGTGACVLLPNGTVFMAAGRVQSTQFSNRPGGKIFDPTTNTWSTTTGTINIWRYHHTATLLSNGTVLLTGGQGQQQNVGGGTGAQASCEIYDPATQTFTLTANSMTQSRFEHSAFLLPNGKVWIYGNQATGANNTSELYDPNAGTFTADALSSGSASDRPLTALNNGTFLAGGHGDDSPSGFYADSEYYTPLKLTLNGLSFLDVTSNAIKITAPTNATPYTLQLPASQGSTNAIIQNDGFGHLIFTPTPTLTSLTLNTPLPVVSGGTGTSTPSLIAGTNITSITGTWPNQTINTWNFSDNEVPSGTIDGSNTTFTLAHFPNSGVVHLYKNGIRQRVPSDYQLIGQTVVFQVAPVSGDTLLVDYRY